jgi:hypothetical protein
MIAAIAGILGAVLRSPIGDGARAPLGQGVTTFLLIGAFLFGWLGVARLRDRGFARLPRTAGWGAVGLCVASFVLAFVLPPIVQPGPASLRPSTSAQLRIVSPQPGDVFHGDPASVPIRLTLTGGRVVRFTSTHLVPDEGHIHVYLDGALVSMTFGLGLTIRVIPGEHRIDAQFVAVDHAPFSPPVQATVSFRVVA